jgi:hypothetical protein
VIGPELQVTVAMFLLRNIMEMVKSGIVRKLLTMHCSTCLLVRSLVKFFGAFVVESTLWSGRQQAKLE